jgi:hypothetical protein
MGASGDVLLGVEEGLIGSRAWELRLSSGGRSVCLLEKLLCLCRCDRVVKFGSHVGMNRAHKRKKSRWRSKTNSCSEVAAAFT